MRSGGGQMVSVLAFYYDDPKSNPAEIFTFILQNWLKRTKINKKRGRVWPFEKQCYLIDSMLYAFGMKDKTSHEGVLTKDRIILKVALKQ